METYLWVYVSGSLQQSLIEEERLFLNISGTISWAEALDLIKINVSYESAFISLYFLTALAIWHDTSSSCHYGFPYIKDCVLELE